MVEPNPLAAEKWNHSELCDQFSISKHCCCQFGQRVVYSHVLYGRLVTIPSLLFILTADVSY